MFRFFVSVLFINTVAILPAFAEQNECTIERHCLKDQSLKVDLERARIRGNIANVSIRLTNQNDTDIEVSIHGEYLSATSFTGERVDMNTNRDTAVITANGVRMLAYSLEFMEPIGEGFDLVLTFDSPDSSYAFFDIQNYN